MLKGKILKFSDSYAIVCSDTLAYQKIKLKPKMEIGQTIYYFEEDVITPSKTVNKPFLSTFKQRSFGFKFVPLLAVLLISVLVFNHQHISPTHLPTYAVISIDINPSLSLLIDDTGLVNQAEAKNVDGINLLKQVSLEKVPLEDAIETIIVAAETSGYLDANKRIFIATAERSNDHMVTELITQVLESSAVDDPYTIYLAEVDYQLYEAAQEKAVSIGHYYLDLQTEVPDDKLFDVETLERVLSDEESSIQKHQPKEKILEMQEKKHKTQDTHKESIIDKQEEKRKQQEIKKEEKNIKQIEKKDKKPSKDKPKTNNKTKST